MTLIFAGTKLIRFQFSILKIKLLIVIENRWFKLEINKKSYINFLFVIEKQIKKINLKSMQKVN
jgi:hypothetical protein